jgi:DivIVA domain-containing protein
MGSSSHLGRSGDGLRRVGRRERVDDRPNRGKIGTGTTVRGGMEGSRRPTCRPRNSRSTVLARDVTEKRFTPTRFRDGYAMDDVDAFLERIHATLTAYEQRTAVDVLADVDVVNARFRPTRFREGYDQDEVDDFLDQVVAVLRRHASAGGR